MGSDDALSWKDQLSTVRDRVVKMEQRRETEKRLQQERNEDALRKRLKDDTPEALNAHFNEIRRKFDRAVRKFYPLPHVEGALQEITDFGDLLYFYKDCIPQFGKVFQPNHRTVIKSLLGELGNLQRGLDRQLKQWRQVDEVTAEVTFRAREDADNEPLAAVAKAFSERAHSVPLSIPSDYFGHEKENYWVVDYADDVIGYVKFWPEDKVVTFAIGTIEKVNFNKLVRGVLHKFFTGDVLSEKLSAVRVRVSYVREVRFFTDMGFVRAETRGPSDWIYEREID